MRYAFLTTLLPLQLEEEVRRFSVQNMQDAANVLQWNIYNGLCENLKNEIQILNVLPVGSFPQYYKNAFVKKCVFDTPYSQNNINIGFCNVKFIRKYLQPKCIYHTLNDWCLTDQEPKTLFVYTISAPFMTAVAKIKKKYPTLQVCAIVADLPNMSSLSNKKSVFQKLFEKYLASVSYGKFDCVDSFVLLTKQMADYMHITKPFVVVEGIAPVVEPIEKKEEGRTKNILYTGTLHKRFGVLNLLHAFQKLQQPNYRLVICGIGDSETEIKEAAKKDLRIDFKGQLKREAVLKLQKEATVLVNPRQNNEEFTKYSFPSKTMEYLASGVPLIAYKLDGIPDEYDAYIHYVSDDSVEALAELISFVCEEPVEERQAYALKAQQFVQQEKNALVQTKKIVNLIETLNLKDNR